YSTTLPFNPLGEAGDPVTYRPDKTILNTVMICGFLTIRDTHGRTISSGYQLAFHFFHHLSVDSELRMISPFDNGAGIFPAIRVTS
ncbi:TPA: hypothetical protein ACTNPT_003600, partial [Salmonella enterica subsp. enterica serovar Enteritidis]